MENAVVRATGKWLNAPEARYANEGDVPEAQVIGEGEKFKVPKYKPGDRKSTGAAVRAWADSVGVDPLAVSDVAMKAADRGLTPNEFVNKLRVTEGGKK